MTRIIRRKTKEGDINAEWSSDMAKLAEDIEKVFRYKPKRWQGNCIDTVLKGKDILVRAGTGSGKSLIYQALCLVKSMSIVLVIAPINALMENQVYTPICNPELSSRS